MRFEKVGLQHDPPNSLLGSVASNQLFQITRRVENTGRALRTCVRKKFAVSTRISIKVSFNSRGVPARIVWDGRWHRVSDQPTALLAVLAGQVTHLPASSLIGWRFQGTDEEGQTRVFDILLDSEQSQWILVGTYQ
jgi:hypothetical protein